MKKNHDEFFNEETADFKQEQTQVLELLRMFQSVNEEKFFTHLAPQPKALEYFELKTFHPVQNFNLVTHFKKEEDLAMFFKLLNFSKEIDNLVDFVDEKSFYHTRYLFYMGLWTRFIHRKVEIKTRMPNLRKMYQSAEKVYDKFKENHLFLMGMKKSEQILLKKRKKKSKRGRKKIEQYILNFDQ